MTSHIFNKKFKINAKKCFNISLGPSQRGKGKFLEGRISAMAGQYELDTAPEEFFFSWKNLLPGPGAKSFFLGTF